MISRNPLAVAGVALLPICLTGCKAVGAIFKAGVWVGVLGVLGLVVVVVLLMGLSRR
jgi:hypothetical protein